MRKTLVVAGVLLALSGCGDKTDTGSSKPDSLETNFATAVDQYLEKNGDLCLGLTSWPVDIDEADFLPANATFGTEARQMSALEALGIATRTDTVAGKGRGKIRRYSLSDEGKRFIRERDVISTGLDGNKTVKQGDLCYGKLQLDKVVKWTGPVKLGDYQEATVNFTYKIKGLATWAEKPEFQKDFPDAAKVITDEGTAERSRLLKLISTGWQVSGLN